MSQHARRTFAILTAVVLAGLLMLGAAAPASAHDELVSTFPSVDSTVDSSPTEITLTFSAALNPDPGTIVIEVVGPEGANYAVDPASVEDETFVVQHLRDDAPNGLFTVLWKVVSSDGHPISGEYSYTVAAAVASAPTPMPTTVDAAQPTSEPTVAANNDTGAEGHGEPSGGGALLPILAVVTGALILGSGLIVVLMVARERRRRDRDAAQNGADDE